MGMEAFGIDFLSELTQKYLQKMTYVLDDFIFIEKDKAEMQYFIINGKVAMLQKITHTFLTDLGKDSGFGELGMLTGQPRSLSAKSRDFTEVLVIRRDDFYRVKEDYLSAARAFKKIRVSVLLKGDYRILNLHCYLCNKKNHLALKCHYFKNIKGNLLRMYIDQ